jgi:hypothetical protein
MTTSRRNLSGLLAALLLLQTAVALPAPCGVMPATGAIPRDGTCCCVNRPAPTTRSGCCRQEEPERKGPVMENEGCGCRVAPLPDPEPARPAVLVDGTEGISRRIHAAAWRFAHRLASTVPANNAGTNAVPVPRAGAPPPGWIRGSHPLAALLHELGGTWAQRVLGIALL